MEIYNRCAGSWNTDNGCLIGIRNRDIEQAMEWMEIDRDDRLMLSDQVQILIGAIIKEQAKERERKREAGGKHAATQG